MLTGAVLGAVIVLLLFIIAFLGGKVRMQSEQLVALNKAQADLENQLGRAISTLQEAQKPYIVNFKNDEIMAIAEMIWKRTQVLIEAQDQAALRKMN